MKRKQIVILLVLVAIIGAIGFILQKRSQSEWAQSSASAAKILDFPINDVARVLIRGANGHVNIAKKNDLWVVEERADYPADFERAGKLIRQLWELHPVQELKVGESQFPRLELVEPGPPQDRSAMATQGNKPGTVVELKDKDGKTLAKLVAGKQNMRKAEAPQQFPMPMGRYVLAPSRDGGSKVALVSQTIDVDAKPESWLKHDFIKIENPESIALEGQTVAKHWTLTRSDAKGDWKLADAKGTEEINKPVVSSFGSMLAALRIADVLPPDANPAEHGLDKPQALTVRTFDRFAYTLKIGNPSDQNYAVAVSITADPVTERSASPDEKPEDKAKLDEEFKGRLKQLEEKAVSEKKFEKRIYVIPKFNLDTFLKDRADLLAKPTVSPSPSATPGRKR
jgi:Domain of unknown function (DUF4340)